MNTRRSPEQRAGRLVRLYPRRWRARYGDEFTQFLADELSEHGLTPRWTADIVAHGLWTRIIPTEARGSAGPRRRLSA